MAQTARILDRAEGFSAGVDDPLVRRAAAYLIERNRRLRLPVEITVLDKRAEALAALEGKLEELGVAHAMSAPLIAALHDYIQAHALEFNADAGLPVRIHLQVANELPERLFDESVTEVLCIGSDSIRCEGAADVKRGLGISGEEMTSNAANVDAIFASVKGLHLWVRFELPSRKALEGLMAGIGAAVSGIAAGIGGAGGGALDAEGIAQVMEALAQQGLLTPQVEALLVNLIALQQGAAAMSAPQMSELLAEIAAQVKDGQESGLLPAAVVETVMQALGEMTEHAMVREFFIENGFTDFLGDPAALGAEMQVAMLMDRLEGLAALDGIDADTAAQIEAIIEETQAQLAQEGADVAAILQNLSENLTGIAAQDDVPAAVFAGIADILPAIAMVRQEAALAAAAPNLPGADAAGLSVSPEQMEAMAAMIADVAAQVENGQIDPETLPPEMQAVIAGMGGVEAIMQAGPAAVQARFESRMPDMPAASSKPSAPAVAAGGAKISGNAAAPAQQAQTARPEKPVAANNNTVSHQVLSVGLAAMAMTLPATGAQVPAGDKAAAMLVRQAVAELNAVKGGDLSAAPDKAILIVQKLIDARAAVSNPAVKDKIAAHIDKIIQRAPELAPRIEALKPTPKPGCGDLCDCHKKTGKPQVSEAAARKKAETLFKPDELKKLGGLDRIAEKIRALPEDYTPEKVRDFIEQSRLIEDMAGSAPRLSDQQMVSGMQAELQAFLARQGGAGAGAGADATHNFNNCACGQDHSGGAHEKTKKGFTDQSVKDDSADVVNPADHDTVDWGSYGQRAPVLNR